MSSVDPNARAGSDLERQALGALRKMRERLDLLESARCEPLAIVGMACRLPGAPDIDTFWELLQRGGDAIRDIPRERWNLARDVRGGAGADLNVVQQAGLLDRVDGFDAEFFGIAWREAQLMDPQQRLFLEVVWEALESAGMPPTSLKGTRTGVFVGTTTTDYLHLLYERLSAAELDAYIVSGNTLNATAGRISYTLGLQGPAMAIDTACSSSLVAIDRACRSVRDGESRLAIAGGVNLILTPEILLSLARWGMLSPEGRCKTFDAAANGFVRAEGCGVVLIKRLSDALADGDRVWALVRGWAVNQDGPSSGFSVPNGLAQASVLRDALAMAALAPRSVGCVEAHGTGTSLGDPIEMEALASVYGTDRDPARPLVVGAVKSNVGHLEAAAGVTGFIKTVLALRHRQIPPVVHLRHPTPHIPWQQIPVHVPTTLEAWQPIDGRRIAGVSAFGFSGTNAHIVLEEAPEPSRAGLPAPLPAHLPAHLPALLLTLSARSPAALEELAVRHAQGLERHAAGDVEAAAAICLAASAGRSHLPYRMAVTGADAHDLARRLRAATSGDMASGSARARVGGAERPAVAFLFTGQGSQYIGMGRRLAQTSPVFRAALQGCAALIDPLLDRRLLDVINGEGNDDSDPSALNQTGYTQPALFAIQIALVALWRSFGVIPSLVIGHSVGEFAAACCAGVLSLEEAATLVTLRGRLMQELPAGGAMAALFASEQKVRDRLAAVSGTVAIAGINGPEETVVSGDARAVQALVDGFAAQGVRAEPIPVSHAFHSPLMRPMLARFETAAGAITRSAPQLTVVSSLTGRLADDTWGTAAYWLRQLEAPVRYADALQTAVSHGMPLAVEIGPHPVLAGLGRRALPDAPVAWLPSLRRGRDDGSTLMATLAELYVQGAVDDWSGSAGAAQRGRVALPSYPFQRTRCWVDAPTPAAAAPHVAAAPWCHPLLGVALSLASEDRIFESAAGHATHTFLREHRLHTHSVWPAAASAEMMLAALHEAPRGGTAQAQDFELHDLELRAPLLLPDDAEVVVQTVLRPDSQGGFGLEVCRTPQSPGDRWLTVAAARALPSPKAAAGVALDMAALRRRSSEPVDVPAFYAAMASRGAQFGGSFRSLDQVTCAPGEAFGHARLAEPLCAGAAAYRVHPVLLDAALQLVSIAAGDGAASGGLLLFPTHVTRLAWHAPGGASTAWCHAVLAPGAAEARTVWADLSVWQEDGTPLASLQGVRFERLHAADLGLAAAGLVTSAGYEWTWRRAASPDLSIGERTRWLVLDDGQRHGEAVAQALRAQGCSVAVEPLDAAASGQRRSADLIRASAATLGGAPQHVVNLRPLDLVETPNDAPSLDGLRPVLESALQLVQACAALANSPPPRLWLVTRQALALLPGEPASPLAAALWGLWRVARAEHPDLGCTLVDVDAAWSAPVLAGALRHGEAQETQIAIRSGSVWLARLARLREREDFRLTAPRPGRIEDLALTPFVPSEPSPGEICIAVHAAGLNFRDVLCVLGMYPGSVDALGGECAGVVTAVGTGVHALAPGDEVLALAPGSLGTSVIVPEHYAVRRPASLSREQAAALPVACLTASYALERLAALQPGERVLIHAAAGGVGMAAVQIARLCGAEVYATAGSEAKRDQLRALGVSHVLDSRSLAFRDTILEQTGGRGVDVVLNSLAGDFIAASLSVLAPGGRFLEMGKRDIWSRDAVARQYPQLRYWAFDLSEEAARDATLVPQLFATLLQRIEAGLFAPLPVTTFPLGRPHEAFETMAHARHTGKLVLSHSPAPAPRPVDAASTYLVSGGFGALGLEVAAGLVARGARHLVLLGRSPPSPTAAQTIQRFEDQGVAVFQAHLDVADLAALRSLVDELSARMLPLRGVVHAAGLLDDGVLAQQNVSRFDAVLRPKLLGGLNLALLTEGADLDFFVLFSAGAAWLGAPGQGNYAAANTALDALAQSLRASGRRATSIAWGRWSGGGMAGGHVGGATNWSTMGVGDIAPTQGIEAMFDLVKRGTSVASVLPIDWRVYLSRVYAGGAPRCFSEVLPAATSASPTASADASVLTQLQALPAHQRREALQLRLEAMLRKVVGVPGEKPIDPRLPMRDLGMDSLMTVDLRNAVGRAFERTLPATVVFDHPTLDALTEHLMSSLEGLQPTAPAEAEASPPDDEAAQVHAMSEAEAEAELLRELALDATPVRQGSTR